MRSSWACGPVFDTILEFCKNYFHPRFRSIAAFFLRLGFKSIFFFWYPFHECLYDRYTLSKHLKAGLLWSTGITKEIEYCSLTLFSTPPSSSVKILWYCRWSYFSIILSRHHPPVADRNSLRVTPTISFVDHYTQRRCLAWQWKLLCQSWNRWRQRNNPNPVSNWVQKLPALWWE